MSRIRTVKPEFWTSEQVISCSPLARLLFIGLWNFCDDNGVHPASLVRIKAEVFPVDACTTDNIKCWISELINNELLREYTVNDKTYWIVTGWKNHQRIDKPTYRHPLPLSSLQIINSMTTIEKLCEHSTNIPRELAERSPSISQIVEEISTTDRNVMERIGKENKICEVKTSPCSVSENNQFSNLQEIFEYWQSTMNHPRAKLDNKRERKIIQALDNYTVAELKQAIDGCAKTPYNMGNNDRHQRYDDIELILRDASHIERFINHVTNPPSINTKNYSNASDLMEGVI